LSAKPFFPPGTLAALAAARGRAARQSGALQSIATDLHHLDDGGIRFLVRVLASLHQKEREAAARQQAAAAEGAAPANPFLPHDERLFVADLSPTHFCLLNKFNVVDGHLLLLTRAFEDQERLLTPADLEAMAICLTEIDGLGFFNGGTTAGASQPHKHLQLVPLPLAADGPALPIEPLLAPVLAAARPGVPRTVPGFAFRHALLRLEGEPTAAVLDQAYCSLLEATGLAGSGARQARAEARPAAPYNLLVTRRWMLIVPRSRERLEGIAVNALGYAGSLFVRDESEMAVVERIGPLRLITAAAVADS
jgi:sulfate adenylyltransferase (ADP) / ATP adenylyltransferase